LALLTRHTMGVASTVLICEPNFALDDANGSHSRLLEASMHVIH
jgi:hypothetical protein